MVTYVVVVPQLHSSDARKPLISEVFNFQFPWAPCYTFVLPELSFDLNDPSFLVFVFLRILIESNHISIKDVHIDPEREEKKKEKRNSMFGML